MMTVDCPFFFIINPHAGLGVQGFHPLAARLRAQGVAFFAAATTGSGDARTLARLASRGNFRAIVCHGGDGTMNEIVNGIAKDGGSIPTDVVLGLIPSGTAQDLARGLDIPRVRTAALDRLLEGNEVALDVGRMTFADGRQHLFLNVFGAGFDAVIAKYAQDARSAMPSIPAHVLGFASALAEYQHQTISLRLTGGIDAPTEPIPCSVVVAANGPSYAAGMRIAPAAIMDDGLLDVVVIGDVDRFELLWNLPRVYAGTHLNHNKVTAYRAREFVVESTGNALVQADGEVVGRLPARVDVLPRALRFLR